MPKYNPKVSIITPCMNSQKTIKDTIESVLGQTYLNIEYIIVDGASTDDTMKIVRAYEPLFQGRLRVISEKDSGIYDAMNKGILHAQGDIVGIVNSDDWYQKNTIEKVVNIFEHNSVDLVYGNIIQVVDNKKCEKEVCPDISTIWYQMALPHPAVFVKKGIYLKYGMFKTQYYIAADYEFILRLYAEKVSFYYLNEGLTYFRTGGVSQINASLGKQEEYEIAYQYIAKCPCKEQIFPILKENYGFFLLEELLKKDPDVLNRILKNYFEKDIKEIAIFGVGNWGNKCYEVLDQTDVLIKYFLDNNPNGRKDFHGKKLLKPDDIEKKDDYILIAIRYYDKEIKAQLTAMQIKNVVSIGEIVEQYICLDFYTDINKEYD